jgi:D-lactate dehydrogenase (cytochrome)
MRKISGSSNVQQEIPDILHDESRFESGVPSVVCFPESTDELRQVIREASDAGQHITFIGAQTGTTGGAVPVEGSCAVAFSAMNRIVEVNWEDPSAPVLICEPGITLDEIEKFCTAPASWHEPVPGSERLGADLFFYPPDPTELTAQLGGTVATNASGARSYLFGPTRDHIRALELVLSSSETVMLRRSRDSAAQWDRLLVTDQGTRISVPALSYVSPPIKNAAGYFNRPDMDPIDLFIGSEGTLAAIVRVGIALKKRSDILAGLTFFQSTDAAFDFSDFLRKEPQVAAIEFFDGGSLSFINRYRNRLPDDFPEFPAGASAAVLWEYIENEPDQFENSMEEWEEALGGCGSSLENTWSGFDASEKERLHQFRHALPEMINSVVAENKRTFKEIRKIGTDSAFPDACFREAYGEMMEHISSSGLTYAAFGHLGNCHIHINLLPSDAGELDSALGLYDRLMAIAVGHLGTVSAEHGIGKIKTKYLEAMYGKEAVRDMRKVKTTLDPHGMFNPGNLFTA